MPTLSWLTRERDVKAADGVPYRLLERDASLSAGEGASGNMLIQDDNLEALKSLLPYYRGQVKCIYIDPPYNTRSAFEHYDDNLQHAEWLAMIWPRLVLLRELLREDGSIWVSVDDGWKAVGPLQGSNCGDQTSSNGGVCKRLLVCGRRLPGHGRLRGRQEPPHHGASRDGSSNVRSARIEPGLAVQRPKRNEPAYVPAGTPRHAIRRCRALGSGGSGRPGEQFARTQHRMHDDRKFAGDGDCGALEADLLAKLHAPAA